jgi:outer membrane protein assembly factor BamB
MAASQFIALLQSRGLLDPEIVAELHRQVEQTKGRITPEAIAKLLVENGQLTRFQATKLVTELNENLGSDRIDPSAALRGGRPLPPNPKDHDSVEDLLPDDMMDVEVVEQVPNADNKIEEVEIVDVASTKSVRPSRRTSADDSMGVDLGDAPRRIVRDTNIVKKNAWESFRILGYGFIVAVLLIVLIPLLNWMMQGNANEAWDKGESAYKGREYDKAHHFFEDFNKNHSGDSRASKSRVFMGLSRIRQDAEKAADPGVALKTCKDLLPGIAGEAGLTDLRGDVTDTILRILEKFIAKMERTPGTSDRKAMLEKMNEQMEFTKDVRYVGTQERTQNELRLRKIEEDQNRLMREIVRSDDLASTIVEMTASVKEKNVSKTYELRRTLLRKYPQLQSDTKLTGLLNEANSLQQSLVTPASKSPTVNTDARVVEKADHVLLSSRTAKGVDGDSGSTIYLRADGSVVAMNAGNGKVLWRHLIGRDWTGEPRRLGTTGESDVLVYVQERGLVKRLAAADGTVLWETKLDGRIVSPSIDADDIFVAMQSGEVFCLDAITGQTRWGKKLPQAVDVGIGGSAARKKRYVLGNHSNLYVLSQAGGQCDEVVYVGHNPSSIAVPPIWVANQLVIFENDGSDYSSMRVFTTNDQGLDLKQTQNPITFRGHVVIEPQVEGARIAVATNLGEVAIMDVDPNNAKDKVTKLISLTENETIPKNTWPLMVGTDLWLASTRLLYYQVQVTSQKLNRQWLKEDGDQFTNRPIKVDDYIVHSRIVRGNLGVRVTAMSPSKGEPVWETDVGVPVVSLAPTNNGWITSTSQGSVYSIEPSALSAKKSLEQVENLGRNQRSMMFLSPVQLKDGKVVLLNQAKGNQLLLIDPAKSTSNPSRIMALDLGEAFPSGEPLAVASGAIVVPLDNAQIALIDPEKGKQIGTPFQPTIQAGEKPKWLNPVLLSDNQSVVVADEKRSMVKLSTGKQLRPVTSQPLDRLLKGRLTVIKDMVVAVSAIASGDQLDFYDSNELKVKASVSVEGRFAWGPYTLESSNGSVVLALSDIEGLIACDETGKKLWSKSLGKIVLVGRPTNLDADCLLASTRGELLRIAISDGSVLARVQVGEPISGTPLQTKTGLLVPCDEGSVLSVPAPVAGQMSSEDVGAN